MHGYYVLSLLGINSRLKQPILEAQQQFGVTVVAPLSTPDRARTTSTFCQPPLSHRGPTAVHSGPRQDHLNTLPATAVPPLSHRGPTSVHSGPRQDHLNTLPATAVPQLSCLGHARTAHHLDFRASWLFYTEIEIKNHIFSSYFHSFTFFSSWRRPRRTER